MKFKDRSTRYLLKQFKSRELEARIADYPEEQRFGRSDLQILRDEVDWYIDNLEDEGHRLNKELNIARKIIKETERGTVPLHPYLLIPKYSQDQIDMAHDLVNEYNRLKELKAELYKER